jgi:probable HAF family extracellular repeat protein
MFLNALQSWIRHGAPSAAVGRSGLRVRRGARDLCLEALEVRRLLSYSIVDLSGFAPAALSNAGAVVGSVNGHAALQANGTLIDLGTLGGATSRANAINNLGQVVGTADLPSGVHHAFLITPQDTTGDGLPDVWFRDDDNNGVNDLMTDLGTLGGPNSEARGINDLGQVVGRADSSTAAGSFRAFVWDSATGMQNLGTFGLPVNPSGLNSGSEANAINNHGEVVGTVYSLWQGMLNNGMQGFRWSPQNGVNLLGPMYSGTARQATGINDAGQIVGTSGRINSANVILHWYVATDAFLWQSGTTTSLGFAMNSTSNVNVSINDKGQVVGSHYLWESGVHIDLNSVLDPAAGVTVSQTAGINDAGQIAGQGMVNGESHGMVLDADPSQPVCFIVTGFPTTTTAGANGSFTVTALNGLNAPPVGYTGTVHFTSSDPQAALPADYTFTPDEGGIHIFNATLKTAGTQSLTVADALLPSLTATEPGILVTPAAATRLQITGPGSVKAGRAFSITVTAYDAYGNIATGYTGTVAFKSSDSMATLPKNYTFTAVDGGVHTFTGLILKRRGTQTIVVTDTLTGSLLTSLTVNVT